MAALKFRYGDPHSALEIELLRHLRYVPPPAAPRYVLVEALDEVVTPPGTRSTIPDLLEWSRLETLPSWLRIVATSRRDKRVMKRLAGLRAVHIDAGGDSNRDDLKAYVNARMNQAALRDSTLGQACPRTLRCRGSADPAGRACRGGSPGRRRRGTAHAIAARAVPALHALPPVRLRLAAGRRPRLVDPPRARPATLVNQGLKEPIADQTVCSLDAALRLYIAMSLRCTSFSSVSPS